MEWLATTLLCDHAQVADGKLFISGGGWSLCGPGAFVHGLAFKLGVPWDHANRKHALRASLHDEDGSKVTIGEPPTGIGFESQFEVGRPAGLPPGSYLDVPLAVNLGPLELPAGKGYVWVISIDDVEVSRVSFRTRAT